jgi:hypothetical protein
MPDERLLLCGGNMSVCAIATGEENVKQFLELIKKPEIKAVLNLIVENILATSELKILKRIAAIESKLGLNDLDFEDEDHELTIPEQLSLLAERIDIITEPVTSQDPIKPVVDTNPKTTLEHKASALVEHLKTNVKPRNGEVFLNTREIIQFLKYEITEAYRLKDIQNPRQAKKDIVEKAKKMFSDLISLDKKKHGNRDIRIVYKPKNDNMIPNRMGTYVRS